VKIAFIALPKPENIVPVPPLPLGYIAALLEQQRHIVRIYDLALTGAASLNEALRPLRAFRPHITVVEAGDLAAVAAIEAALADCDTALIRLGIGLREVTPGMAVAQALWRVGHHPNTEDEQNVIFGTLLALDDDLDSLPFPARHLLSLEQYPLVTPAGELQTTVLIGQQFSTESIIPRNPALIVAELRSIAREQGIRHVVFCGLPLTHDLEWMRTTLDHLATSNLNIGWEGSVGYEHLTPKLLELCRRSGCEVLRFTFNAADVLDSKTARAALSAVVEQAHALDISVRAHIWLEPPYEAIAMLVDMSATFNLDGVRFSVREHAATRTNIVGEQLAMEEVAEMARSRYRSRRSRQFFIERFGPRLGPMLWRVGRAGLLGRTWQRYANNEEESSGLIARSFSS
jgi:hypothetical protein